MNMVSSNNCKKGFCITVLCSSNVLGTFAGCCDKNIPKFEEVTKDKFLTAEDIETDRYKIYRRPEEIEKLNSDGLGLINTTIGFVLSGRTEQSSRVNKLATSIGEWKGKKDVIYSFYAKNGKFYKHTGEVKPENIEKDLNVLIIKIKNSQKVTDLSLITGIKKK